MFLFDRAEGKKCETILCDVRPRKREKKIGVSVKAFVGFRASIVHLCACLSLEFTALRHTRSAFVKTVSRAELKSTHSQSESNEAHRNLIELTSNHFAFRDDRLGHSRGSYE